jgi:large subunit ribosomal protein L25
MGNKLYVTQVPTPDFKIMHHNTVICQVRFLVQLWKQLKKQQKQQKHL